MKDQELTELQLTAIKKVLNCKSPATLRGMIEALNKVVYNASRSKEPIQVARAPAYDLPPDSYSRRFAIIEAFGEKRRPVEWSSLLGLTRHTFWRYIEKGMTIEQIVEYRSIEYPPKK